MNLRLLVVGVAFATVHCAKTESKPAGDAGPAIATSSSAASVSATTLPGVAAPASVAAARMHPCGLLTPADVEAALGTKDFTPEEHAGTDPMGSPQCIWHLPHGRGFVEVMLKPLTAAVDFDRMAVLMKQAPVEGVGDKAYSQPNLHWGHVDVLKSGQVFMLQTSRGNIATGMTESVNQMQEQAVTLARKVAGEL
jgi:hypothetical protein